MDDRSHIEMIYLAVEYILIGAFLVMVTYAMSLRNDFAQSRNEQIANEIKINQYRKFNSYDLGECTGEACLNHIYGDEVIELIRRYYDNSDFEIYIDKTSQTGSSLRVNRSSVLKNPDTYKLSNLQKLIDSKSEFHPYLVYNGVDPSTITSYYQGSLGSVTGMVLKWKKDNKVVTSP